RRLRQLDLLEELHDNISRQKKLEQDLAKRLGNKAIPLESRNTLVTSTDEKIWAFYEQEDPAWEELHLLDGVIPTLAPEQEIETAIATCPALRAPGVYPNRTPALEALCGAVLRVLAASREKAPGTGGRSIGVAQLADGSFMIAVSGKTDDAIFIE